MPDVGAYLKDPKTGEAYRAGGASGPQPAASSQSVTPASDGAVFPIGGVAYNGAPTLVPAGSRVNAWFTRSGAQVGTIGQWMNVNTSIGPSIVFPFGQNGGDTTISPLATVGYVFDGNLHPAAGDTTGAWVHGPASTPVQQGGTIAASGGTAAVTFVSTADTEIVNPSTATLWGSWGTPAVNGANSYPIAAGGSYRPPNRPAGTFTLLSTAANQTYTVTRF